MNVSRTCPFFPGAALISPRMTRPLRHPHDALVRRAVPSQTAGPGALSLNPVSITPPPPSTAPPAPPLRFKNSSVQAIVPSPTTTVRRSPPSRSLLHRRGRLLQAAIPVQNDYCTPPRATPSTTASRGPRIKPLLEVLSAAVNGSPRSVSLNKTTTEHDPPSPPSTTAFPDPRGPAPGPPPELSWTAPPGPPRLIRKTRGATR